VQFDKIVSVEMLEAVGHENLPAFFQACERVLKPDGVVVLQVITQPDQLYDDYRKRSDFIQKYVFPGSHLPSLTALSSAISKYSNLVIESVENIGPHYARTLREWRERFMSSREAVQGLGYDERFERLWNFYLSSCEALFATRWLNVLQLVLTRPNNSRLMAADRPILAEASFASQSMAAQSATANLSAPKECVLH
jgi:cyclopropane-fatty-acyl-phospholipid synthase